MTKFLLSICLLVLSFHTLSYAAQYPVLNQTCDGFSQVAVGSYQGTCVGLVSQFEGFKKPRKALQLDDFRLLVTDMGGWSANRGVLWLVTSSKPNLKGKLEVVALIEQLNLPHDIEFDAKRRVLLGEAHQMRRLTLELGRIVSDEVVLSDFPYKDSLHPLSNFAQLHGGNLVINVGSKTDHCEGGMIEGECVELADNGLWNYTYDSELDTYSSNATHLAKGLRNSMALAVHSSGTLLQAENSSDIKNAEEPYEELNVIKTGGFYGWPYCLNENFDQNVIEDGCEQANYQAPYVLLPPHTAPLDMLYVNSSRLPVLDGKLLMSWHGYRVVGNRLVAYKVDKKGLPVLTDQAWFKRDPIAPKTEWSTHAFDAKGGMTRQAQHVELIHSWNKVEGLRPEGAPVGLAMLKDETLLIVDDKNKALLRLAPGNSYLAEHTVSGEDHAKTRTIDLDLQENEALKRVLLDHCSACHQALTSAPETLLNTSDAWLSKEAGMTRIEQALFNEMRPMPPTASLNQDEKVQLIKQIKQALAVPQS
ncbi:PQQ-dependent sugar dehydrogenase [Marinomonas sp. PE14-40]|uniref:PQQ-dependent sugar dehydrogenase n=1 Tax=Marinomonas sp. PE14-40 TaxID=3060621 RepID=UPI003F67F501